MSAGPDVNRIDPTMTGLPACSITGILDRLKKLGMVERHHDRATVAVLSRRSPRTALPRLRGSRSRSWTSSSYC